MLGAKKFGSGLTFVVALSQAFRGLRPAPYSRLGPLRAHREGQVC